MTCNQHYGIANYPPCSGNGDCIDGRCICHQGWFDTSDYNNVPGLDCDNNVNAIKYWSLFNLIVTCITVPVISYCLYKEIRFVLDQAKPLWTFGGKHTLMAFAWSANVSIFLLCVFKYLDPSNEVVGSRQHLEMSVFSWTAMSSIAYTVSVFHLILVKFLRGHLIFMDAQMREHLTKVMNVTSSFAIVFPTMFSTSLLIVTVTSLVRPAKPHDIYASFILLSLAIAYIYYASTILYIFETFLRELSKYITQMQTKIDASTHSNQLTSPVSNESVTFNSVKALYAKFKMVNHLFTPSVVAGIPLNLSFLCWSFLRRKATYLLVFQSTMFIFVTPVLSWSIRSFKVFNHSSASPSRSSKRSFGFNSKSSKVSGIVSSRLNPSHKTPSKSYRKITIVSTMARPVIENESSRISNNIGQVVPV
jgi:hypothetical protein